MKFEFSLMEQIQPVSIFTLLLAFIILYKLCNYGRKNNKNGKPTTPEASGGIPIMGHLHLFNETESIHKTLGSMADKHGPAFIIRFGSHKTLVVSSWKIIKECFTTNDILFSNRPGPLAMKLMFYNGNSMGYAPYGSYWREVRKISTLHLLSNYRLETLKQLITSEVESCFKQLMNSWEGNINEDSGFAPVRLDDWFGDLTVNAVARIVAGKKNFVQGAGRYKLVMDEAVGLMRMLAFSDVIPLFGWLDKLRGLIGQMKHCGSEIDSIVGSWVEEHQLKRKKVSMSGRHDQGEGVEKDFIDVCLDIMEQSSLPAGHDPLLVIKAISLDLVVGASDTTSVTLTWAISLLLNHPQVLKRAREELDAQVGKERQVEHSDIPKLPFIQAIIKETMRLYPAGPLIERQTMEDCEVGGFHIPAGTRLLVNLWKLHRDKEIWTEPLEFRPERFLTNNREVDLKGQHYELIPFGAGRRICPGVSFALQLMNLVLARFVHTFEITTPMGLKVDMTESTGLISQKVTPLEVLIKPRFMVQ